LLNGISISFFTDSPARIRSFIGRANKKDNDKDIVGVVIIGRCENTYHLW